MASFDELIESQNSTQALMLRILPNFNKLAKAKRTAAAVRSRLESLQNLWTAYKFLLINDTVEEVRDALTEFLGKVEPRESSQASNVVHNAQEVGTSAIQLPKIDIPKFSGELTEWENFRDVFNSLVAGRNDLSNVQKLHYLKANLIGDARRVLASIHVTDANYTTAWALLKRRYDNPRAIVNAHQQNLVDIPSVSSHSVTDLKVLRDRTCDIYTALLNLKRPVNLWEDLLIFVTVSKLDESTRQDWKLSLGDHVELPNFAELDGFLSARIRAREAARSQSKAVGKSEGDRAKRSGIVRSHQASSTNAQCIECEGNHPTNHCKLFLNKSVEQRIEVLKLNKCCFNCLRRGHRPWSCKSKNVCTVCKHKHHSLIHRYVSGMRNDPPAISTTNARDSNADDASGHKRDNIGDVSSHNFASYSVNAALLPTAFVLLRSNVERALRVRALLDQGSQASFVSESVVRLLRADRKTVAVNVSGIGGGSSGKVRTVASFSIEPCAEEGPVLPVSALVLPKLTAYLPKPLTSDNTAEFLRSLNLADSEPASRERVELIIGADYYGSMLRDGLLHGPEDSLIAQLTIFGWVVSGPARCAPGADIRRIIVNHLAAQDELDGALRRFWEIEEVPLAPVLSEEESQCEAYFLETHSRQTDGRYVVRSPFKGAKPIPIGETEKDAKRIFLASEARLQRQPGLARLYQGFMAEYENLHHMEKISHSELALRQHVYFPHHAAIKESCLGKRVRVVFNASRPSSNATSLNDHLHIGQKLQADLFVLILKWRAFRYVYTTDLEKMFRQILVHPADVDFQRIFWRTDPRAELSAYRLLTVTYGTASAPFLANRVLKQLAADEGTRFPLAVPILENGVYVDDLMFGDEDILWLRQAQLQLTQLLRAGGFRTHKWVANDPRLMQNIPTSERSASVTKSLCEDSTLKVLGILWSPTVDSFKIYVQTMPCSVFTKHSFLVVQNI